MATIDDKARNFLEQPFVGTVTTLRQDPRVSLLVVDPENTYKWVAVSGTAELTTEGADAQIDKLAKKYLGQDEYPWRNPEEQRITVRIRPEHIDAAGLDD